jgi:hypothetical protein
MVMADRRRISRGKLGFFTGARVLREHRRRTTHQSIDAQIFVEIRPVQAVSRARDFPISPLLSRCVQKLRVSD